MKPVYKRFLILGICVSLAVLAASQSWETEEDSGSGTEDTSDEQPAPPASLSQVERTQFAFKPLAGTRVTFSGTVVRAGRLLALRETAGVLYTLDSAGRALPFEGDSVRVTGQLDTSTRLLHIDDIQPAIA